MDDAGDLVLVQHPLERGQLGDVAPDELDLGHVIPEDELEAMPGVAEIEADDADAGVEQRSRGPRADAPEDPRHEGALRHVARPGRR